MKLIIAGSRTLNPSSDLILDLLGHFLIPDPEEIVCGGAKGVDAAGELFANDMKVTNGINIKVVRFEADWEKHGKAAGPIRNRQMAEYGDALLLIWDGKSRGSQNMKSEMLKLKKSVYEVILK